MKIREVVANSRHKGRETKEEIAHNANGCARTVMNFITPCPNNCLECYNMDTKKISK